MTQTLSPKRPPRAVGTMRAAVLTAPQSIEIRDVPIPNPAPGEVRIRLEGCGVCASNIPPWEGRDWFNYPMTPGQLGHEGWGVVDAVGQDVSRFSVGQRVAMLSDHAYADYDLVAEDKIIALPPELADHPFPAEPLGCAMNIFQRSQIRPGSTIAIIGIGFLGAILTRLAANIDARVIAMSRRPFSLDVAKQMGAAQTVAMDDHCRIIEEVRRLTGGIFCDVVIEAAGKQWPIDLAGEITRERGRLVVAGYHQDGPRQVNMQLWNWRGIDVINAHERDPKVYLAGMRAACQAVLAGDLDPAPLYTHRLPLEQLADALELTRRRPEGFIKALITM